MLSKHLKPLELSCKYLTKYLPNPLKYHSSVSLIFAGILCFWFSIRIVSQMKTSKWTTEKMVPLRNGDNFCPDNRKDPTFNFKGWTILVLKWDWGWREGLGNFSEQELLSNLSSYKIFAFFVCWFFFNFC